MKEKKHGLAKTLFASAVVGVIALGAATLTTEPASAKPPTGPLCGPTILYECTSRNGTTELVGLTVCEVARYERKNKATCEPFSF